MNPAPVRVLALLMFAGTIAWAQSADPPVVVRPVEIHDVLVNPGMGITTFQRFNGDALNSGLGWSEEGPTARILPPTAPPDFPDTSIAYCRWFWDVIEPEPGKFRWEIIDDAIAEARVHHQTLAIRLMPYDPKHPLPEWYRNSGARRANKPTDKDGAIWQPDFTDPLYLKFWGELVAAAGERYDGLPDIDTVDISSIGYWGEGWSPYMPPFPYQKAAIDVWLDAFKRTPLLMNFDEQEALTYGTEHGAGWRLDCLGDMRLTSDNKDFRAEMLTVYPQQVVRAGIQDVWQRSPVSLESCWVPGYWRKQGWDVNYILDQALRWHVSSVNIKSSAIPADWKVIFDDFQRKMGYRFVLRRLEYPGSARAGSMMPVHMWWLNSGVAPVYQDYWLAIKLKSRDGAESAVIRVPVDVRKWLPGDAVFDGTLYVPESLKPGAYTVEVGMLDPLTWPAGPPAIRFAIEGREPDGWYDMGSIAIQ
ncbi:MAG TPA: DUF4832 domain-containing protein [Terriglobia bacterium]|nr:DUF4832 domain-containing protein [Terriglobia bacterium]